MVITASSLKEQIREVLPRTARPARYAGGELNAIRKPLHEVSVTFALAFPDIYEIGMSNLGLRILYDVLNSQPEVTAERVFAPALDMEEQMRGVGIPLFSLESSLPVREFDVVGFSLAYELTYTTVLNMLDLAGIHLSAGGRRPDEPIVIAGGHCATNPEPMAEFIDAFVIGDGEEVVVEIAQAIAKHKGNRKAILAALSEIDGVYVPIHTPPGSRVRSRVVLDLDSAAFPLKPIIPFVESVHDRAVLEIMRGCGRGCRFCQAGMITRPTRERSLPVLIEQAKEIVRNSGYDEIALTSLSSSDHTDIEELVRTLIDSNETGRIGVSLPSLRADASCVRLAEQIQRVRKTGLTFAPEAGTQRLRDVINKNVTDKDLLEAIDAAVQSGWKRVKLYFMIGLPTETDEDLAGIAELVRQVIAVGRKHRVSLAVNVTISPFVPKPHTPFQWRAMDSVQELSRKIALLRPMMQGPNIKLSWHEPACSQIEAALARGDRKVSAAIYEAWKRGSKLEQENFDDGRWRAAFEAAGIRVEDYANRQILVDAALPWDYVDVGVTREFLESEDAAADSARVTPDCRWGECSGCGVRSRISPASCPPVQQLRQVEQVSDATAEQHSRSAEPQTDPQNLSTSRLLLRFSKGTDALWLGHLDLIRVFERAIRISGIPVAYTQGFNPRVKMSIASALPLGATADRDVVILSVNDPVNLGGVVSGLNRAMPPGIQIVEAEIIPEGIKGPWPTADEFQLNIVLPCETSLKHIEQAVQEIIACSSIPWERKSEKSRRQLDLRPGIDALSVIGTTANNTAQVRVLLPHREFTVKPSEVFELIRERIPGVELRSVHRSDLIMENRTTTPAGRENTPKGGEQVCQKR